MKSWGIIATFGFAILAVLFGQAIGGAAVLAFGPVNLAMLAEQGTAAITENGTVLAIGALVANPVQIVTVVLAARLAGIGAIQYLALEWPRWRAVGVSFAVLAALVAVSDLSSYALGRNIVSSFQLAINRTAQADGTLLWLWLAIVVAAPAGEEILFRGFMFRGFVHEPRNALPGIVVIALIWASLHLFQYDIYDIAEIGIFGIVLGYVRYLSGSTALTIALHALYNLESQVETYIALGWL